MCWQLLCFCRKCVQDMILALQLVSFSRRGMFFVSLNQKLAAYRLCFALIKTCNIYALSRVLH